MSELVKPTPAELEILHVIWSEGPSRVGDVQEGIKPRSDKAYTTVMTLMDLMYQKGLLLREKSGRAFVYRAAVPRSKTLRGMVNDLRRRAFGNSSAELVEHLLRGGRPGKREMAKIRALLDSYEKR